MPEIDASTIKASPAYWPSGKCSWRVLPLFVAAAIVAIAMAYVLWFCETDYYVTIVTPVAVGLPVLGGVVGLVHLGKCRNPRLATTMGIALVLIYYAAYWEISYRRNIVAHGAQSIELVEQLGGARGAIGYFLFKCRIADSRDIHQASPGAYHPPAPGGGVLNYLAYAAELAILLFLGVRLALWASRRVFYENLGRWSLSYEFQVQPGDITTAVEATFSQDWDELADLRRVESDITTRLKTSALLYKIEFAEGFQDQPLYLTLRANRLGISGLRVVEQYGGKGAFFLLQQPLGVDSSRRLFRRFSKELKGVYAVPE